MNIYKQAIETFGEKKQLLKTAEELTELAKELIKYCNGAKNVKSIIKENIDVEITLEYVKLKFAKEMNKNGYYSTEKAKKLLRLERIIEKENIKKSKQAKEKEPSIEKELIRLKRKYTNKHRSINYELKKDTFAIWNWDKITNVLEERAYSKNKKGLLFAELYLLEG